MLLGARQFFERRGAPTPPLPYDAEVEYIESTGTQYINTGINPESSTTWSTDIVCLPNSGIRYMSLIGYAYSSLGVQSVGITNQKWSQTSLSVDYTNPTLVHADQTGQTFNGIQGNSNNIGNGLLYLFNRTNGLNQYPWIGKIYSAKIWIESILVRDLIPVCFTNELDQSEGAMYDKVSGQLFRNQGTGAFLYGRDTNPISARSYVQDGLVAMWDGVENAGWGKHSNAPTNWKNLVGAGDILLDTHFLYSFIDNELITTGQYGTNTQYNTVPIVASILNTTEWTIEVIAYAQGKNQPILRTYPWGAGGAFVFERGNNVTYLTLQDITGTKTFAGTGDAATGYMTAYTLRFINNVLYRDWRVVGGVEQSDEIAWTKPALKTTDYSIGSDCHYHAIRLYNRALTAAEIAANYAIDKARFNLP